MVSSVLTLDIHGGSVVALCAILLAITTVIVALRFYTRYTLASEFKTDDWLMIPCWFFFLGIAIVEFIGVHHKVIGYPLPHSNVQHQNTEEFAAQIYLAFDFLQPSVLGCAKISAIFFFRRIFCSRRKDFFSHVTVVFIVVLLIWTVLFMFLQLFQCGYHIDALWVPTLHNQYCGMAAPIFQAFAISDFILDVFIILLPIPKIWQLHTTPRQKLELTGIFMLSLVGLAAGIIRMLIYVLLTNYAIHDPAAIKNVDERLTSTSAIFFGTLEAGMTIIAVNLPSLYGLLRKIAPEGVIKGMTSLISLRSMSSKKSDNSQQSRCSRACDKRNELMRPEKALTDFSNGVDAHMIDSDSKAARVLTNEDDDTPSVPTPNFGAIRVSKSVSVTGERQQEDV